LKIQKYCAHDLGRTQTLEMLNYMTILRLYTLTDRKKKVQKALKYGT